jgi:uncharacterized protein (TIGR02246 family)
MSIGQITSRAWPRAGAWLLGLTLAGSLVACGSPSPSASPSDVQRQADLYAINQIEVKWHQAASRKDLDLMMSLWADNATFTTASQTYSGKDQIRQFFTGAAPFKPENKWVSDTPAYKSRATVDGDKGTLYFQCDYIDVDTKLVKISVGADQQVARINGTWLITSGVSATPSLGG